MKISFRRIFGFLVLVFGLFFAGILIKSLINDLPLWFFGQKTTATIVDNTIENPIPGQVAFQYYFEYEFSTEDGAVYTGRARVNESEYLFYEIGNEIEVKYIPGKPENNRMNDSRFVPILVCTYIPVIMVCIFALIAGREILDS